MWHPLVDVVEYAQVGTYRLHVRFDDGDEQTIDFEPVLYLSLIHISEPTRPY